MRLGMLLLFLLIVSSFLTVTKVLAGQQGRKYASEMPDGDPYFQEAEEVRIRRSRDHKQDRRSWFCYKSFSGTIA